MKHTKEEIINALHVIKDECDGTACSYCPFGYGENSCKLICTNPANWKIAEITPETWRVLK